MAALAASASAQFTIADTVGPFAPAFRGLSNTTWFGWGSGSFDGTPDNGLIDNPAATIGTTPFGYSLSQIGNDLALAGSNNIYTQAPLITLQVGIPVYPGLFTTIILQGRTAFGGFGSDPVFQDIGGVSPTVVVGTNATGSAQFWAEYKIPNTGASQTAYIDLAMHTSLNTLTVDTYTSSTGYATDTVQAIPEPTALVFVAGGVGMLLMHRRRPGSLPAR